MRIPEHGASEEAVLKQLEEYRANDVPWRSGRTFGYVYDGGREAEAVAKKAYMSFLSENALDPTVYPSLLRFENEIVGMAARHLNGDADVVGNFTSGGTESIILACKAARDRERARRPDLGTPEIILPVTGHAAFHKAATYLGMKVVPARVDPGTFKADVAAVRSALSPNTVLLVASAPSYAHGVVDPVAEIGQVALEHDRLFHVDGCIGGFLLPYFAKLGDAVPPFDFSVPGVTSISMDLHKYAYAAKGASVILYRDKSLRRHQLFTSAAWTGYTMINTTIQSSKSGGPLAAAWAVLQFLGEDGYLELARQVRDASRRLVEGIDAIDGLYVMGKPEMTLIAVASDELSVFHVIDLMRERQWYIQPQLAFDGLKENFHLLVSPGNTAWVEQFLTDLDECTQQAKTLESGAMARQIEEAFATIDPDSLSKETFDQMLGMAGIGSYDIPEKMADINEILNALPQRLAEKLLGEFVNELFRQPSE